MATKQEIQAKIDSLEFAKSLLEKELLPLREQLAAIELKIQNLIDGEIVPLKTALVEEEQRLEKAWSENAFANNRQTRNAAEFFRGCGYLITECQTSAPSDVTYKLAKQLWSCYKIALPLMKRLYKEKSPFLYSLDGLGNEEKNSLANLCRTMAANSWLSFERGKAGLDIKPSVPRQHRNFLNGGWAEAVNRYLIYRTLHSYSGDIP